MVAPAIGLAYVIVAPTTLRRRLIHLAAAAFVCLGSAGWFVVLTLLWPASSRPYLAGSTDNNFMNLVLGYNGVARVLGRDHGGGFMFGPSIGSALGSNVRISSAHRGCSPASSASRSAGCSPPPCSRCWWSSSRAGGHHAPTSPAAALSSSAAGC